jgi:D-xylose transport system permease protein
MSNVTTTPPVTDPRSSGGAQLTPTRGGLKDAFRPLSEYFHAYVSRMRGGDMGALPAVMGLLVLSGIFTVARPSAFSSALNLANLFQQGAVVVTIAMGLVFVLLLGEIDLSAGFASGVCGSVMAVLLTHAGAPWFVAVAAAIATGVLIGLLIGTLVARIGIPSFVVTLGAFLAFQGVVLLIIGGGGNISITSPVIIAIQNKNVPPLLGWILAVIAVATYSIGTMVNWAVRRRDGLATKPLVVALLKPIAVTVVTLAVVFVLNLERSLNVRIASLRGVPIVVPLIVLIAMVLGFVLRRTAFGRHVYAVGGNAEAARRAGINVARIRIACFVLCSGLAAVAGIFAASRATSVDPNAGGQNILLYAVGAAVIGGTSLFGGKGRIVDALIGGAVVAVIDNGMGLLGYSAGVKYLVTGAVLILAAGVDALSRRRSVASGGA